MIWLLKELEHDYLEMLVCYFGYFVVIFVVERLFQKDYHFLPVFAVLGIFKRYAQICGKPSDQKVVVRFTDFAVFIVVHVGESCAHATVRQQVVLVATSHHELGVLNIPVFVHVRVLDNFLKFFVYQSQSKESL